MRETDSTVDQRRVAAEGCRYTALPMAALATRPEVVAAWEELWRQQAAPLPFQHPGWVLPWARHLAEDCLPVAALAFQDRRLVGLAPLVVQGRAVAGLPLSRLLFAATTATDTLDLGWFDRLVGIDQRLGWADAMDVLVAPDHQPSTMTSGLLAAVLERWPVEVVDLRDLPASSQQRAVSLVSLAGRRWSMQEQPRPASYLIDLAGGMAAYRRGLSRRERRNQRLAANRLVKMGGEVAVRCHREEHEVAAVLPRLVAVERQSWKGGRQCGLFAGANGGFHLEMARRLAAGRGAVVVTLEHRGQIIAYYLALVAGATWYLHGTAFLEAYRHCSPGAYLFHETVAVAADCGAGQVVIGRGPEQFKKSLATGVAARYRLVAYRQNLPAQLSRLLEWRLRPLAQRCRHWMTREREGG